MNEGCERSGRRSKDAIADFEAIDTLTYRHDFTGTLVAKRPCVTWK
jgi:hypothetical protein